MTFTSTSRTLSFRRFALSSGAAARRSVVPGWLKLKLVRPGARRDAEARPLDDAPATSADLAYVLGAVARKPSRPD